MNIPPAPARVWTAVTVVVATAAAAVVVHVHHDRYRTHIEGDRARFAAEATANWWLARHNAVAADTVAAADALAGLHAAVSRHLHNPTARGSRDVADAAQRVAAAADELTSTMARPGPAPEHEPTVEWSRHLATVTAEVAAISEQAPAWASDLHQLAEAAAAFATTVDGLEVGEAGPDVLLGRYDALAAAVEVWQRQLNAASAGPLANAHRMWTSEMSAFIDEAVLLLEDGDTDAYNTLVAEVESRFVVDAMLEDVAVAEGQRGVPGRITDLHHRLAAGLAGTPAAS